MSELYPVTLLEAKRFVNEHHRHNKAALSWKFGVGLALDGDLVGVAMIGRPSSQELANLEPRTIEITRCTTLGSKNACSRLYGAACRMAKAAGYWEAITYTLESEPGSSLLASGFSRDHFCEAGETRRTGRYESNLFGEATRPEEGKWRWRKILVPAEER